MFILPNIDFLKSSDFVFSRIWWSYCRVVDRVFFVVFEGYKTGTCAVNFYTIKYISSFCVLCDVFVYNILDSFCWFLISCSYCINKNTCPLNGNCLLKSILYIATIKPGKKNYQRRTYQGISENTFKQWYGNHKR